MFRTDSVISGQKTDEDQSTPGEIETKRSTGELVFYRKYEHISLSTSETRALTVAG